MSRIDADVAVLGAGFGGSLTALLLSRIGLKSVLLDRGAHPRFAIGESSTPIADLVLASLARQYNVPRIAPLAKHGTWQAAYPHLACGLKRGFSYFRHRPDEPFTPGERHHNELLVAANPDDAAGDTHWYRPDFDQFIFAEAREAGVKCLERTEIGAINRQGDGWSLEARQKDRPIQVSSRFLVDASGEGQVLAKHLGIPAEPKPPRTRARSIYAHFRGVRPWSEVLRSRGGRIEQHPFCCDDAALHHIIDGGWTWILRFNNGVTSAGFMLDIDAYPADPAISVADEWSGILERYPSIAEQFAEARVVAPEGGLRRTGRLQRQAARFVGPGWAMLPTTAGFFDALHSTGNAHTLCGIQRLVGILKGRWNTSALPEALQAYERTLREELSLMDTLVHGCYLGFEDFKLFTAFAMWYFAAATVSEHRRRAGVAAGDSFLQAHDPAFRAAVERHYEQLCRSRRPGDPGALDPKRFQEQVAADIRPYNLVGLCDPTKQNMYGYAEADSPSAR